MILGLMNPRDHSSYGIATTEPCRQRQKYIKGKNMAAICRKQLHLQCTGSLIAKTDMKQWQNNLRKHSQTDNINKWCNKTGEQMFYIYFVCKGVTLTMATSTSWSPVTRILMVSLMVITEGMSSMFFITCLHSTLSMDRTKTITAM